MKKKDLLYRFFRGLRDILEGKRGGQKRGGQVYV
jgi:hypothetical protein